MEEPATTKSDGFAAGQLQLYVVKRDENNTRSFQCSNRRHIGYPNIRPRLQRLPAAKRARGKRPMMVCRQGGYWYLCH